MSVLWELNDVLWELDDVLWGEEATPVNIEVPLTTLTLTVFNPDVLAGGALIEVPLTTLTLTVFNPEIVTAVNIEVPLTTLTLTVYSPSIALGVVIEVPLTTLTLTLPTAYIFTLPPPNYSAGPNGQPRIKVTSIQWRVRQRNL